MNPVYLYELGGIPIDRNALNVTIPGECYEPGNYKGIGKGTIVFDVMPALDENTPKPHGLKDLTGVRNGRLVIVAYWGSGGRWLCRCDCGKYTIRRGKSMLRPKSDGNGDRCVMCERWKKIKERELFERTGKYPDQIGRNS